MLVDTPDRNGTNVDFSNMTPAEKVTGDHKRSPCHSSCRSTGGELKRRECTHTCVHCHEFISFPSTRSSSLSQGTWRIASLSPFKNMLSPCRAGHLLGPPLVIGSSPLPPPTLVLKTCKRTGPRSTRNHATVTSFMSLKHPFPRVPRFRFPSVSLPPFDILSIATHSATATAPSAVATTKDGHARALSGRTKAKARIKVVPACVAAVLAARAASPASPVAGVTST